MQRGPPDQEKEIIFCQSQSFGQTLEVSFGQIDLLPVDIWLVHVGTIDKKQSDNNLVVVQHRLRQKTMKEEET